MGWWSPTILGGDTAYDIIADIQSILRGNLTALKVSKKKLNANLPAVLAWCLRNKDNQWEDRRNIAGQVLGVLILQSGANMPDNARKHVLACARADRWAKRDEARKTQVDAFIAQVEAYESGKPVVVAEQGLFESLAQTLVKNFDIKPLINKKP